MSAQNSDATPSLENAPDAEPAVASAEVKKAPAAKKSAEKAESASVASKAEAKNEAGADKAIQAALKSAIVDWNGKQYQLQEGRYLDIDTRAELPDAEIIFDRVLLAQVGEQTWVGAPQVEGAQVVARVLSHGRKAKILVYKMRCKKGYRRKNGHRQGFTRIQVTQVKVPA